jgi:hypothetical protein
VDLDKVVELVRKFGWKKATVIGLLVLGAIVQCVDGSPPPVSTTSASSEGSLSSKPPERSKATASTSPRSAPPQQEQAPAAPTEKQLQLDADYHAEWTKDPSRDIDAIVAKKHGITKEQLAEEQMSVALYRDWLRKRAEASVGSGVTGSVKVQGLDRTELGIHTLKLALTVTRCPEGPAEADKQIEFLATTALKQIVQNLPYEIDSYQASIRHRGLGCDEGSVGYVGHWSRASGRLTLR